MVGAPRVKTSWGIVESTYVSGSGEPVRVCGFVMTLSGPVIVRLSASAHRLPMSVRNQNVTNIVGAGLDVSEWLLIC